MKKSSLVSKLLAVLALICIMPSAAPAAGEQAPDLPAIKKRMTTRLKEIVELKKDEKIGENNLGYLTIRKELSKEEKSIIDSENADRKQVYEDLAKKNKTSTKVVGQQRAIAIAKNAKAGDWLQDANGKWYQKKADNK